MRAWRWVFGTLAMTALSGGCGDDESPTRTVSDADGDGWPAPLDCVDNNPDVFPGADEVPYDGIDQDCSGSDLTDVDQDGFDGGETGSDGEGGAAGAGGSGAAEDCDDRRPDVNPAAVDVCGDGIDQDCSGADQPCDELDRDGDGVTGAEGDCNDLDPSIGPERDEIYYNGVDDDCDPATDDGDQDGDGFSRDSGGDCNDEDAEIFPGAEEIPYDGIDQDCSGADLVDVDGDGVPGGPEGSDCDDLDATVRPGRDEVVVDGVDQNCDGSDLAGVDEFAVFSTAAAVPADAAAIAGGENADGDPVALVAWLDSRTALRQEVFAQVLREDGSRSGGEIEVAAGGLEKFNVQVASDGENFLVTWETADGVFGRLLTAEGPTAEATQIAPVGASASASSFGGGNYAVVWQQGDADPPELRIRMLSREGVKDENRLIVADASASGVAIAGRPGGLIAAWSSAGIQAQLLDGRGQRVGEPIELVAADAVSAPSVAASDAGYLVAYQRAVAPFSVHAIGIDAAGEPLGRAARLSDDSVFIEDATAIAVPDGFFVAWSDSRHTVVPPAYSAVYANSTSPEGMPLHASDRPLHVELNVRLGGMARVGERVLLSSRNTLGLGVIALEAD